jgi:transcriptional regulator with XRE-family HTH domain
LDTLKHLFGSLVRAHRVGAAMSQAQLAELAGISEVWLRKIEQGAASPSFDTIDRLAVSLQVQPMELFGGLPAVGASASGAFTDVVRRLSGRDVAELQQIAAMIDLLRR